MKAMFALIQMYVLALLFTVCATAGVALMYIVCREVWRVIVT